MGSIVFRPTSTYSGYEHTCYPSGNAPHTLVDDEVPDGDSTYLWSSIKSTSNTSANTQMVFSGKLPSKNVIITSLTVHVTARCSTTSLTNRRVNVLFPWIEGMSTTTFSVKTNLTTSYADYSAEITAPVPYIQPLITDTGELEFPMTVRSVGAKSSGKNASSGNIRITQVYIVVNYEEIIEELKIKINGVYTTISKMYIKENGVWVEQNIKEFFGARENNTKFEYIYGGDIE